MKIKNKKIKSKKTLGKKRILDINYALKFVKTPNVKIQTRVLF